MVNEISVKILREGVIEVGSEEIPVENVYLMKNITNINDKDFTDTEFALRFDNNSNYYKIKKLDTFDIKT